MSISRGPGGSCQKAVRVGNSNLRQAIYRKDETETLSHSLITKFETQKKKITNLRQWPRPLLQNFKTKKLVVKTDVSSGGVGRQSQGDDESP